MLPLDPDERRAAIKKDFFTFEKSKTSVDLDKKLDEYLIYNSKVFQQSKSQIIFMLMRIALVALWLQKNPPELRKIYPDIADELINNIRNTSVEFYYNENGVLKFNLKKTTIFQKGIDAKMSIEKSPMTKTLAGLPVMGEIQTQKREGGT